MADSVTKDYSVHIRLLKKAREFIIDYRHSFVCYALHSASYYEKNSSAEVEYLKKWIANMLDGSQTLEDWLSKNRTVEYVAVNDLRHYSRDLRLAWIEWMINELENG